MCTGTGSVLSLVISSIVKSFMRNVVKMIVIVVATGVRYWSAVKPFSVKDVRGLHNGPRSRTRESIRELHKTNAVVIRWK